MKKFTTVAALTSTLLLQGCVTTENPFTGVKELTNKTVGGIIGAVSSAVLCRNSSKEALCYGGITLAGVGIGEYFDQQEAALRQLLGSTGVSVTRYGDQLKLNMPHNITFDVNQYTVRPEFHRTLQAVCEVFKEFDETQITVAGHTDASGPASYNQTLSENRAAAVQNHFTSANCGINSARISSIGYGETQLLDTVNQNSPANRRVEIHIRAQ